MNQAVREENKENLYSQKAVFETAYPTKENLKPQWVHQVRSAKIAWDNIAEIDLLNTDGQLDKLSGLIHKHYSISYVQAVKQVTVFLKRKYP